MGELVRRFAAIIVVPSELPRLRVSVIAERPSTRASCELGRDKAAPASLLICAIIA